MQLLLDRGAAVDQAQETGATPLLIACEMGHVACASLVLDSGAAVDRATLRGWTPLHHACARGYASAAALLLDRGAAIELALPNGSTPWYPVWKSKFRGRPASRQLGSFRRRFLDVRQGGTESVLLVQGAK